MNLTDIAGLSLAPNGKTLAIVTRRAVLARDGYEDLLHVLDLRSSNLHTLASVSTPARARNGFLDQSPIWFADGDRLALIANLDGSDQVWAWNLTGGNPVKLTHAPEGVLTLGGTAGDGKLAYTTFSYGSSADELREKAADVRTEGMVVSPPVFWGDYLGAAGVQKYLSRRAGIRISYWLLDVESLSGRALSGQELREAFPEGFPGIANIDSSKFIDLAGVLIQPWSGVRKARATARSPEGQLAVHVQKEISGQRFDFIQIEDEAGASVERYRKLEGRLEHLHWSRDGSRLFFLEGSHGPNGRLRSLKQIDSAGHASTLYSTSNDIGRVLYGENDSLIMAESNAQRPEFLVKVDLGNGRAVELFDPNPWIKSRSMPAARRLAWTNRFGVQSHGLLLLPEVAQPLPPLVVVTYRDAGFLRGGVGDEYPVYPLVEAGFAVFVLDVGDVAVTGAGFGEPDLQLRRWRSQLSTVEEGMKAAVAMGGFDPARCAMTGLSFGADLTWMAISHTGLFKTAIVSDSGFDIFASHLRGLYGHPAGATPGDYLPVPSLSGEDEALWREVSPARRAASIRTPVLLNDSDQEFFASREIATALQGLGKPLEIVIYPDQGHILNRPGPRYSVYRRNVDWLKFWLMGIEASSPGREEQFARWALLKQQHEWNEREWAAGRDPAKKFVAQRKLMTFGAVPIEDIAPALISWPHLAN